MSSWPPGSSVINVAGIVALRAVTGTARLIEESLLKGFLGGVSCEAAREGSLVRSLFFERKKSCGRKESLLWSRVAREEAAKAAARLALWQVSMLLLSVTGEDWSFVVTGKR